MKTEKLLYNLKFLVLIEALCIVNEIEEETEETQGTVLIEALCIVNVKLTILEIAAL